MKDTCPYRRLDRVLGRGEGQRPMESGLSHMLWSQSKEPPSRGGGGGCFTGTPKDPLSSSSLTYGIPLTRTEIIYSTRRERLTLEP